MALVPFKPALPAPGLAAGLMLASTAFIAATTLLAKALGTATLGPPLHPLQVAHGRFLFAFLGFAAAASLLRPAIGRPHWRLHVARTVCGFTGVSLLFAAAARAPLSDATAISFLNPVFAMLLAIPLLGERVGPWRWAAAAIALAGALVLLRPGGAALAVGALLALGAALALGLEVIFLKRLAGLERPFQLLLVNNLIGLGIASVAVLAVWQAPTTGQWAALIGVGLAMAVAQSCFLNAVARADASFVVPFSYATLVWAAAYDAAVFGVLPDAVSWAGAGMILGGAALLAWREAGRARPPRADPGPGPGAAG